VLATDAISRESPQGFAELAGIGVVLLTGAEIAAALHQCRDGGRRRRYRAGG
jgi:hypothetical protein